MGAILHWIDQRGCPQAVLEATPAGELLYSRLGFIAIDNTLMYKYSGGETGTFKRIMREIHKANWSLALAEFDRAIFDADRGRILQRYCEDFPGRSFLSRGQNDEINGYLVCRDNHIGPWVAVNEYSARLLLEKPLTLKFAEPPTILIPDRNQLGVKMLEEYGFNLTRSCTHMVRGGNLSPVNREHIYGETSLALG